MNKFQPNSFDLSKYVDVADETPLWSAPFGLKLLDYIDYRKNISALDIGFGTGFPLTEIASRLGESSVVYGIDPWKDAIERARKKIAYYGLSNVRLIEGKAESIPLGNDSVDLITSNNGINNVTNIDQVFSECFRILRQGGQFIQTMNTDLTMFEFYSELKRVLQELQMDQEINMMHQHISHKRPPVDRMLLMLQEHGFVIRDLVHDQFNYVFADGTAMLNHYFIRLAFMDSWLKLLPADKTGQIFDIIETRLNEHSQKSGSIQLSIPYVLINAGKK